jgi:GTP-binding protein
VIIRASRHLATLLDYQYKRSYNAPRGEHGKGGDKTGRGGEDITLQVPVGTIVRDVASGEVIVDLTRDGEEFVAARGGAGGRGNAEFATSTNQAPREFEQGEEGEERELELELKLLADVGLVGLPNAGKSTLISVISAARPKIAEYPFTTLVPNLGIVRVDEGQSFVVADIPGLIAGAHAGKGLGLQFLRHIERTRILVFLLDCTSDDVQRDYKTLVKELRLFNRDLLKKPRIIALTKIDVLDERNRRSLRTVRFGAVPVLSISAVAGIGVTGLIAIMWKSLHRKAPGAGKSR